MTGTINENIHPCKGCEDYIAPNGCKSNGECSPRQEMTAIIKQNNNSIHPIIVEWDNGKKSIMGDSVLDAEKFIRNNLPLNTQIIYEGVERFLY